MGRRVWRESTACVQEGTHEDQRKVSERNSHKPRYWGTFIVLGKAQIVDTGVEPHGLQLTFLVAVGP